MLLCECECMVFCCRKFLVLLCRCVLVISGSVLLYMW